MRVIEMGGGSPNYAPAELVEQGHNAVEVAHLLGRLAGRRVEVERTLTVVPGVRGVNTVDRAERAWTLRDADAETLEELAELDQSGGVLLDALEPAALGERLHTELGDTAAVSEPAKELLHGTLTAGASGQVGPVQPVLAEHVDHLGASDTLAAGEVDDAASRRVELVDIPTRSVAGQASAGGVAGRRERRDLETLGQVQIGHDLVVGRDDVGVHLPRGGGEDVTHGRRELSEDPGRRRDQVAPDARPLVVRGAAEVVDVPDHRRVQERVEPVRFPRAEVRRRRGHRREVVRPVRADRRVTGLVGREQRRQERRGARLFRRAP